MSQSKENVKVDMNASVGDNKCDTTCRKRDWKSILDQEDEPSRIVYLNIGGRHFDVERATLEEIPFFGPFLVDGHEGRFWESIKDRDDRIFISRPSGAMFEDLLMTLSLGHVFLRTIANEEGRVKRLAAEADFFSMPELARTVENMSRPGLIFGEHICLDDKFEELAPRDQEYFFRRISKLSHVEEPGLYLVLFHFEGPMPHLDQQGSTMRGWNDADSLSSILPSLHFPAPTLHSPFEVHDFCGLRIGNIDNRKTSTMTTVGPIYCTHTGVGVVEFSKESKFALVQGRYPGGLQGSSAAISLNNLRDQARLFNQLSLLKLERGAVQAPSYAKFCRRFPKQGSASRNVRWDATINDGLVVQTNDQECFAVQQKGVFLVIGQICVSIDVSPCRTSRIHSGVTLQHVTQAGRTKNLLPFWFHKTESVWQAALGRRDGIQLARVADVLLCDGGDLLSVSSLGGTRLYHSGPLIHRDGNTEFLDIVFLRDALFQGFSSSCVYNNTGFFGFGASHNTWTHIKGNDENKATPFVKLLDDCKAFRFQTSKKILVLASFPPQVQSFSSDPEERIGLLLDNQLQAVSYIEPGTGHFHRFNTIVHVKPNSELGFKTIQAWDDSSAELVLGSEYIGVRKGSGNATVTFIQIQQ